MFVESECKKEEGNLEHNWEALNKEVEAPLLESIAFVLTVSAMFNHRTTCILQVAVEPLFAQHREERGEQQDEETRVHEPSGSDNFTGRVCLDWRNCRGSDSGMVEGEKNCAEEGH